MSKQGNPQALLLEEKAAYGRVEPPCPYFGTCGGCALQDLAYQDQLRLKEERIRRALGALGSVPAFDIIALEDPWRYRNKAELTFSESHGALTLGYHAARSFWRVVDLEDCLLSPEPVTRLLRDVRALAAETGLPPYQPRTHQGFFRYLLVRSSSATGQILVCLITTSGSREVMETLARELMARHAGISSFYWGVTNRLADVAIPEELTLLRGAAYLEDQLGPFRLKLHPLSFLQPVSVQADRMYAFLARTLGAIPDGIAWDLYCGLGLIAFYLARQVRKVYGIDVEPRHLELAAANASLNGLGNIEFRAGRVEALLMDRRFWLQEAKPDVIVVDPPRAGLHPHALSSLLAARPPRIAYVSCNVQSLVRDLQVLLSSFPRYRLSVVQPF
ncbi:MAG: 23S rRNA (uracil(1939)-C(5))-methyltransferase RlmD, partial [Candidatus Omnitrophica bacterium]|nr:23S rRNA (uracil(1939)-C(5))-methyltransferase RlmD [Candidatus Omnitrophota bacterium]